jgi:hypothetical protein
LKKSLAELKQGLVSMTAILNKHQAATQEKSKAPKETPEKPQRSDSHSLKETALHQHQGNIYSMRHEYPQRTTPH